MSKAGDAAIVVREHGSRSHAAHPAGLPDLHFTTGVAAEEKLTVMRKQQRGDGPAFILQYHALARRAIGRGPNPERSARRSCQGSAVWRKHQGLNKRRR